jgi:hypothetical protein
MASAAAKSKVPSCGMVPLDGLMNHFVIFPPYHEACLNSILLVGPIECASGLNLTKVMVVI